MGLQKYSSAHETQTTTLKHTYGKVYYIRYLDDFLLGIKGPKILAVNVRKEISQFIKSDLQFELKYSDLYHAKSSKIRYLNFDIYVPDLKNTDVTGLKEIIAFKKLRNKVKLKKKVIKDRWITFLNRIIQAKIMNKTNQIIAGVTSKIKANKTANSVITRELLDILKVPTEKIVTKHKNTNIDIKELAEKWGIEAKRYLEENWLKDDELNKIIGGQELLDAHKHLLECMSKVVSNKNLTLIVEKNIKNNKTRGNIINHAIQNQNLYPKIYIPQNNFVNQMRE